MSPSNRQPTDPVGRMVRYVNEQLKGQKRNHASGGNCKALQWRRMTRKWMTQVALEVAQQ